MTPEQIAEHIRQQLAAKERDDLDQLGRAQTFRAIVENIERSYTSPQAGNTP